MLSQLSASLMLWLGAMTGLNELNQLSKQPFENVSRAAPPLRRTAAVENPTGTVAASQFAWTAKPAMMYRFRNNTSRIGGRLNTAAAAMRLLQTIWEPCRKFWIPVVSTC